MEDTILQEPKKKIRLQNIIKKRSNKNKKLTVWQYALIGAGGMLILLCVTLVVLKLAINQDHKKVVAEYTARNNATITDEPDGSKRITGYSDGRPFGYIEDNKICSGVSINGIQLGGLTYEEAYDVMSNNINGELCKIGMNIYYDSSCIMLTSTEFGITTDLEEQLHNAFAVGRESDTDFYTNYQTRLAVSKEGVDFTCVLSFNEETLADSIEKVAAALDVAPVEPYITLRSLVGGCKSGVGTGGSTTDVHSSEVVYTPENVAIAEIIYHNGAIGYIVDRNELLTIVSDAFTSGNYDINIEIQPDIVEPKGTVENLKSSMKEISRFSTSFATSNSNRSRNVQKAAGLLHCIEILPGIEQTYNEILGPRTEAGGWLQAPGISGGKEYVDSPGGGICQVSSTLYNALLMVGPGIEITQRYHHSIPGTYVDLGLDATVSTYGPDLAWQNTTDSPLFILSYADMNKKIVYSFIYGTLETNDGYYSLRSEIVEQEEPEAPLMVEEPLWPKGYSQTVIVPRTRYVVNVYRQKYNNDDVAIGEEEFLYQDIYNSVRGEIHYGTGSSSLPKPTN